MALSSIITTANNAIYVSASAKHRLDGLNKDTDHYVDILMKVLAARSELLGCGELEVPELVLHA